MLQPVFSRKALNFCTFRTLLVPGSFSLMQHPMAVFLIPHEFFPLRRWCADYLWLCWWSSADVIARIIRSDKIIIQLMSLLFMGCGHEFIASYSLNHERISLRDSYSLIILICIRVPTNWIGQEHKQLADILLSLIMQ